MRKRWVPIALALLLLLSACGGEPAAETPAPTPTSTAAVEPPAPTREPDPAPYDGPVNPLSGEPIGEEWVNRRPVAIMLNNLREAMPQLGQSQADILYEVPTEGGITRMLGVYQSVEGVGRIGSIRSARPYFLELALGHDAIFIHAGGSEDAYAKIKEWGVTALDGVRGPYMSTREGENLMWRDAQRRKEYSLEHTVVTTGEAILREFAGYTSLRQEHRADVTYGLDFAPVETPADSVLQGGAAAERIHVPFSDYKSTDFVYDADAGKYLAEQYGGAYTDGETGEQAAFTNVVILKTACRGTGDSLGHITVDLSSGGTGWLACGGQWVEIRWSKGFPDGQLRYTDTEGKPVVFGAGHTYTGIIPLEREPEFN